MAEKNNQADFNFLLQMAKTACSAAAGLAQAQPGTHGLSAADTAAKMRGLQRKNALCRQRLTDHLAHEFLPPIERGDLLLLAHAMDRLTGCLVTADAHLADYHAPLSSGIRKGVGHICRCCTALQDAVEQLPKFRKSKLLPVALASARTESAQGEAAFLNALRDLYAKERDPVRLSAGALAANALIGCCDTAAQAADQIEFAVITNT